MECRVVMVEQGSDEWLDIRRCRITASRMRDVCAGKDTLSYTGYLQEKILELLGNKDVEKTPEWARHGKDHEPQALAAYEKKFEVEVEHDVFLIHNDYDWLGASPDLLHLPQYEEGGEIKCRQKYETYREYVAKARRLQGTPRVCPAENRHQVQTNMWLTGHRMWWLIDHYIGNNLEGAHTHKTHRVAVARDQKLINTMEVRALEFMKLAYEGAGLQ